VPFGSRRASAFGVVRQDAAVNRFLRAPAALDEIENGRMKVAGRCGRGVFRLPHAPIMQQDFAARNCNLFSVLILLRNS
jgi:hypothetical protein